MPIVLEQSKTKEELADDILALIPWTPSDPRYAETKREYVNLMKLAELDRLPDCLNPRHLNYNPSLAALVDATQAINEDPTLSEGRSPKAAIKTWLFSRAHEYDLVKADGKPSLLAIEESAKRANPQRRGGAPKTPVRKPNSISQPSAPRHASALRR